MDTEKRLSSAGSSDVPTTEVEKKDLVPDSQGENSQEDLSAKSKSVSEAVVSPSPDKEEEHIHSDLDPDPVLRLHHHDTSNNSPTDMETDICSCCTKSLNLKSASDCEDEFDPPIKIEVDVTEEDLVPPPDPDDPYGHGPAAEVTDGSNSILSKPSVGDILATIFEYPAVARLDKSFFGDDKNDFELCANCDRILNHMYPLYLKFVEIIHHEGQIWKTLLKIGISEPILPMLVYDEGAEDGSSNPNSVYNHPQNQKHSNQSSNYNDKCSSNYGDDDFDQDYRIQNRNYFYKPKKSVARRPRKTKTPKRLPSASNTNNKGNRQHAGYLDDESGDKTYIKAEEPEILELSKAGRPLRKRIRNLSATEDDELFKEEEDTDDEDFYVSDHRNAGQFDVSDGDIVEVDITAPDKNKETKTETEASAPISKKRRARRPKLKSDSAIRRKKKASSSKSKIKKKSETNPTDEKDENDDETMDLEPTKPSKKKDSRKRIRPNRRKENWLHLAKGDPSRTCPVCGKLFYYAKFMLHHKLTKHEGVKPYECKSCGKGFTQKFILKKHKCDYSQVTEGDRDFLKLAREESLRCFQCDVCGKRFKENCHLNNHKLNHREDRPFQCEKCPKCFRRRDHLRMHIRVVHNNERKFVCSLCGKSFKIVSNLKAHERRHNFPDEKHLCPICGKSFDTISLVNRHQQTHDDVLPFSCDICGKRFKMKDYLGQHLRKGKSCKPGMQPKSKNMSHLGGASSAPSVEDGDSNTPASSSFGIGNLHSQNQASTSTGGYHQSQAHGQGQGQGQGPPFTLPGNPMGSSSMPHTHLPQPSDFPLPLPFPYSQLFDNRLTEL